MNKTISRYLSQNILYPRFINDLPSNKLGIVVVIPCFDEPKVVESIESIAKCDPPKCHVEVIISINASEQSNDEIKVRNARSKKELFELKSELPGWLQIYPILKNDLPHKKAGVGLGRKMGMDEAVQRFMTIDKEDGIIVCFDADSKCDPNYLCSIESHFEQKNIESVSINYEHPISGTAYPQEIYESIIQYELHLRYFIRMQRQIGLPYAYHTVGSSMACTVSAYCAVGGMNQRKAGEDFYFIHKLVKFGKHSELNSTKVIPSPRISDRVPFGTGRAIGNMQESGTNVYFTYHPHSFSDLKEMVDYLPKIYINREFGTNLPDGITLFLNSINGSEALHRILHNTSDYASFYKMFWHWFDAFVLMKYLHFVRDRLYPDIPVLQAINKMESSSFDTSRKALIYFRENDVIS